MRLEGPAHYRVAFDASAYRVLSSPGARGLSGLASRRVPKLYIVAHGGWPVYVGTTRQRLSSRFRLGWGADGANGYHGYKFRHALTEAEIDVWCLADAHPERDAANREIEILEAEVVFLIRQHGQWPEHQNEIHFHASEERHRAAARQVFARYSRGAD